MEKGVKISDVNNILYHKNIRGNEKIPISSGQNIPQVVTTGELRNYIKEDIEGSGENNVIEKITFNGQEATVNEATKTAEITYTPPSEKDPTVPSHVKSITLQDINNWNSKQDNITDLNEIRNNALLGKDAYQKPSTGIPKSDLSQEVQNLLDNPSITAETDPIYSQSPAAIITYEDIGHWNSKSDFTGNYNDLYNKPTIPSALIQSDWNQTNTNAKDYIKNKPNIPQGVTVDDALSGTSENPVQNKVINNALNGKQSTIADLNDIRSGANAGATAYQKPANGIPKADLANDVQTSLGKADTALQSYTESDPTVPSHVKAITTTDISNWNSKQPALTFDSTPTAGSNNPVTSAGIKAYVDNATPTITMDDTPTSGSSNPVKSSGIYNALQGKQNTLTFDSTPTASSTNPVTSGGVKAALDLKANQSTTYTKTEVDGLISSESTARQNAIDTETSRAQDAEANRYTKSETYSKEEVNGLITTPDQQYVSVEATSGTTSVTSVLPATGAGDTIYRVGNWNGSQYSENVYTEYAWNTTTNAYVKLSTKNVGIDNMPTKDSVNLVESGGIYDGLNQKVDAEISTNLIDTSVWTSARFKNESGSVQSFSSGSYYNYWRMTDYINVSEHIGEYISVTNHNGYCFYNGSKGAISNSGESLGMSYPSNSSTEPILIPEGATYVRLVLWYRGNAVQTPMANFGQTLDEYMEYGSKRLPAEIVFNRNLGEKILYENIIHDKVVEFLTSKDLYIGVPIKYDYSINNSTGAEQSISSAYETVLTDYIEVKSNTAYFGSLKKVGFYDKDLSYISYTQSVPFTTPLNCKYIRSELGYPNIYSKDFPGYYLVEGNEIPDDLVQFQRHIPKSYIEKRAFYKSVLDRMKSLFDPTVKTAISIVGDSNTYGLESGDTGRRIENCWANLLCNKIISTYNKITDVYPYGKYGTWCGPKYSSTCKIASSDNFVSLNFYGEILKINFGTVQRGVVNIIIDNNEPIVFDVTQSNVFETTELSEDYHYVVITRNSGSSQVSSISVKKYVTAVNNGVSGTSTSSLPFTNYENNIYIVVYGTNSRGGASATTWMEHDFSRFIANQEYNGNEVILITPTPATDGFEKGTQAGVKMEDIDRGIKNVCAYFNHEPLSFYEYLVNYCRLTGTVLDNLLTDTLHIKESTHKMLYNFLCDKLGLGQSIEDLL